MCNGYFYGVDDGGSGSLRIISQDMNLTVKSRWDGRGLSMGGDRHHVFYDEYLIVDTATYQRIVGGWT